MLYHLENKYVVFTGALHTMNHQEAMSLALSLGAKPKDNVSAKVQIIVAGSIRKGLGQKLTTERLSYANKNNITVINEYDFLTWCAHRIDYLRNNLKAR